MIDILPEYSTDCSNIEINYVCKSSLTSRTRRFTGHYGDGEIAIYFLELTSPQ